MYRPWYDWTMLQSFTGTFDACGIRFLRIERDGVSSDEAPRSGANFWAVLDSRDIPLIFRAMTAGDRSAALMLISEHSRSIGIILPH